MFAKAFVINLPFKTDRLDKFQKSLPECFGPVEVWPAVHGDSVQHPDWWTAGRGAWGCYRSHLQILEHCYQNKVDSYLVFEDDAIFRDDCCDSFHKLCQELPADWEMAYLGGQLLHEIANPPRRVSDHVFIPYNVNRTHCFAVHQRGYEKLYKHLNAVPFHQNEHIDHHLGRLHETGAIRVYCPGKWLIGQDGGSSNISGNNQPASFWVDPERLVRKDWIKESMTCVFLHSTVDVAIELEKRGWHRGHWQNDQRLDRGICEAVSSLDSRPGLQGWYRAVLPEAVRQGNKCICLFHPSLSWDCVKTLPFDDLVHVQCGTADQAEKMLADHQRSKTSTAIEVIGSTVTIDYLGAPMTFTMQKDLIYHIWPKRGNGTWQWNVAELLKRIDTFNGIRSIAVVTDDHSDSLETVQAAFAGVRIDHWITGQNNPTLGEVATFKQLLDTLVQDGFRTTFYGHAKGVTYDNPNQTREWTSMMYEVCLDDPTFVEASLSQYPITGPFLCETPWPDGPKHGWHYSGTFFWFINSHVFEKPDWSDIRQDYWGTELWPGNLFPRREAGTLFGAGVNRLYNTSEVERMRWWLDEWRTRKRGAAAEILSVPESVPVVLPATWPTISVVIPTLGRPSLKRMIDSLVPQMVDGDEIIVVADGHGAFNRSLPIINDELARRIDVCLCSISDEQSCYGNAQRNCGMATASKDLIWFIDDDDVALPGALQSIRETMAMDRTPTMFRMRHLGEIVWKDRYLMSGNVGGPMLVVPNVPDLPRFPVPAVNPKLSDSEWMEAVQDKLGIRWVDSPIYECTGHGEGKL